LLLPLFYVIVINAIALINRKEAVMEHSAKFYSKLNAQEVIEELLSLDPPEYYDLKIVSYKEGLEIEHESLSIRLDARGEKTTLADDTEIIHCLTAEEKRVDIILGKPTERTMQPAAIITETL
jgi:hypothetical protein